MNKLENNKNIWIVLEQYKGSLTSLSKEVLSKGRQIADSLNSNLIGLAISNKADDLAKEAISYGADKVIKVEDPLLKNYSTNAWTKILETLIKKYKPYTIFISASENGRDLGGRICSRMGLGLVAECSQIELTENKDDIKWIRPSFSGKLLSDIRITTKPMIGTIGQGAFKAGKKDLRRIGEIIEEKISIDEDEIGCKFISFEEIPFDTNSVRLDEADVIVAGGMGLKDKKNWHLIEELAQALHGTSGATKPLIDNGWLDKSKQIGISGTKVKAKLYIAVGISGALQHRKGMEDSDLIIAINNDENADIFKVAHYGIVGDLFEILPKMTEEINKNNNKLN